VHDAAAERPHAVGGGFDVSHDEVGQRERVAGAASALVHAHRGRAVVRLPARALAGPPRLDRHAEEVGPEAPGAVGVVGGELDQGQR
jgi:hypothetical protein